LDVAAALDRIARSEGNDALKADARLTQIRKGIEILSRDGIDRAEQIQMLFSDPYVSNWNRRAGGPNGSHRKKPVPRKIHCGCRKKFEKGDRPCITSIRTFT